MSERIGVFVDADFAEAMTRRNEAPSLSEVVPALQRKYQPPSGVAIFASRSALSSPRIAETGTLSYVNLRITNGKSADVALAVAATQELPKLDRLVLFSGDSDFVALVETATKAGVMTTIVAPSRTLAVRLMEAAGNRVDPSELIEAIDGLIRVGDGPRVAAALARYISNTKSRLVVIDNYMSEETVRLAAAADRAVDILLIGKTFDSDARSEALAMTSSGRAVRLIRHLGVHDRWLVVDGEWWHSGHSFKDIGNKLSRISAITNPAEIAEHEDMLRDLVAGGENIAPA